MVIVKLIKITDSTPYLLHIAVSVSVRGFSRVTLPGVSA